MDPEKTDCHLIELNGTQQENIELVRSSTFRLKADMKVSRYYAPKFLEYYSCDGKTGFLIAQEIDSLVLFNNVRSTLWDSITSTDDPIGFYQQFIKKKQ